MYGVNGVQTKTKTKVKVKGKDVLGDWASKAHNFAGFVKT